MSPCTNTLLPSQPSQTLSETVAANSIAWDSAGVTTGPITVPLVLSLGSGLGSAMGAKSGFGILTLSSVCPILAVLVSGFMPCCKGKPEPGTMPTTTTPPPLSLSPAGRFRLPALSACVWLVRSGPYTPRSAGNYDPIKEQE